MKIISNILSIPRRLIIRWLRSSGYSSYYADNAFRKRYDDLFKHKNTTFSQKLWAQKRGFLSNKISFYGLDNKNYKKYLSDFDYFRMHPINGSYSKWIDDKLTMKYILYPFSEYLPGYYYHIYNGEILGLLDCRDANHTRIQDVITLLKSKQVLAAKCVSGSNGEGFYKLAYEGHDFLINDQLSTEGEIVNLITKWRDMKNYEYLITEYIYEHRELRKIWNHTPSTLRIMVIREKNLTPRIAASYIQFGTKKSGIINNQVSGAVSCMLDIKTGLFSGGLITSMTNNYFSKVESKYHPDSRIMLEGEIPHWRMVSEKIIEISSYIPQVRYMGYDVIVTDDGFKIIEINSHQGIQFIQYYHPLLADELNSRFFNSLFDEKNIRLMK